MQKYSPLCFMSIGLTHKQEVKRPTRVKTITSSLGSSIWTNAILTLIHAYPAPPDGSSGTSLSYEMFVQQNSYIVQHSIGQAVDDWCSISLNIMNPVSLMSH